MTRNIVYIYALINPMDNQVFYIGASIDPYHRLGSHISCRNYDGNKKEQIIHDLVSFGMEPEMLIIDETTFALAGYWEEFYFNLYKFYGFDVQKTNTYYSYTPKIRKVLRFEDEEEPNRLINGKDIHHYRRLVFRHFSFFESANHQM
jgi:hypothetical protein